MNTPAPKMVLTDIRKHLLPGYYEWLCENGLEPHITLVLDHPGVDVPNGLRTVNGPVHVNREPTEDNPTTAEVLQLRLLVLNLSPDAIGRISFDSGMIHTQVRFSGKPADVFIPFDAIIRMNPREPHEGVGIPIMGFPYTNKTGIQSVAAESKAPAPVVASIKRERPSFMKLAVDNTKAAPEEKKAEDIADGLKGPVTAAADLTGREQPPA